MKFDLASLRPLGRGCSVVAVLALTGICIRPVEQPAWEWVRAQQPALKLDSLQSALGQGLTVGLLGGFRAITADFFWLQTSSVWEKRDLPATQTFIKLVTAIDPRPLFFWLNGTRIIAYDIPNWRITSAGGYNTVPKEEQRRIDVEQAKLALNYLQGALNHYPDSPLLQVEIANIYLNRMKDKATAAEFYRRAAQLPDGPFYAGRIYAELLRKLGRTQEAYTWLTQSYLKLPKTVDRTQRISEFTVASAMAPIVLERIRELEAELNIPDDQRFKP